MTERSQQGHGGVGAPCPVGGEAGRPLWGPSAGPSQGKRSHRLTQQLHGWEPRGTESPAQTQDAPWPEGGHEPSVPRQAMDTVRSLQTAERGSALKRTGVLTPAAARAGLGDTVLSDTSQTQKDTSFVPPHMEGREGSV